MKANTSRSGHREHEETTKSH